MMSNSRIGLFLLFFLLSLSLGAAPKAKLSTWAIDPDHSAVNFKVRHLGISTVHGSFHGLSGDVTTDEKNILKTKVDAKVDINTISTGVKKRDGHLMSDDFFDAVKFPTASFVSTKVVRAKGQLKMTGNLTIRDVTKEIELMVTEPSKPIKSPDGKQHVGMTATTMIDRTQFGLAWSKFVEGISVVSNDVQIELELELVKNSQ